MILSTFTSHYITPAVLPAAKLAPHHCAHFTLPISNPTSCRLEIDRLVREIDTPAVKEIVDIVFSDLLRLLECLTLIEGYLRPVDAAEETLALFQLIHDEARVLVNFIRNDALNCRAMDGELLDILDGIAFAVNHDLQRVFEPGQGAVTGDMTDHATLSKLYRAYDLLTNCLQQSTITLAMTFDPELVGTRLFNNSDMRYRQSLQLCEDLTTLLQLIQNPEKNLDEPDREMLLNEIDKFRNESLELLNYSDWPQFESFCERIEVAGFSSFQLKAVLHQFRCYLETLLSQVKMRAVLANVFPIQFGANEAPTCWVADVRQSTGPSSAEHSEPNQPWDEFAVAV